MCDSIEKQETEPCQKDGCENEPEWTWFNGKGSLGRYCPICARKELPESTPSYKDEITTQESATSKHSEIMIIPGGGVKPLNSTFPVIRSRKSFDEYTNRETRDQ